MLRVGRDIVGKTCFVFEVKSRWKTMLEISCINDMSSLSRERAHFRIAGSSSLRRRFGTTFALLRLEFFCKKGFVIKTTRCLSYQMKMEKLIGFLLA